MTTIHSLPATRDPQPPARVPPHNHAAEQALLGAILLNNKAYEAVSEFLLPDHFADPAHRRVYDSIVRLIEKGHLASPVTLKSYLEGDEALAPAGGTAYLAKLSSSAVSIINAREHGKLIHDAHLRRALIGIGEDVVNRAFDTADPDLDGMSQIHAAEQELFNLASHGETEGGFVPFSAALNGALLMAETAHKREGGLAGVTTGLEAMDRKLGGLHASDLLILAARPAMGKTALAMAVAFNAAKAAADGEYSGAPAAFFSLEMSAEQLAMRLIAEKSGVSGHKLRTGHLSNDEFERVAATVAELQAIPLHIDATPGISVSAMRARCRRLKRQGGLGLIVVDYLQLMSAAPGQRPENRVQELSAITKGLKALAKELNVPVVALSQLNRSVEARDDKRPQLADLRESGSIEQDADVVMFLFREQYYLEKSEPVQRQDEADDKFRERHLKWMERSEKVHNKADVIIAKHRNGPVGTVSLFFDKELTRFADLAEDDELPEMRD